MTILSVDTTSRDINIALFSKGKTFSMHTDVGIKNYESITPLIKSLIKKAKIKINQIDYFGVCIGPGSFTGIRIGLSTMKALAYSLNKPLVGYKSLDLYAWMNRDEFSGLLCIVQDARRNNIFSAVFSNYGSFQRVGPYSLSDIRQLLERLKKSHKKKSNISFYGDMAKEHKSEIKRVFPDSRVLSEKVTRLKADAMISLTRDRLKYKSDSFGLAPFYMYPRDCQVRKVAKI